MTDAMRTFRAYLNTHDRLVTEIRGFDPGTDRDESADLWVPVYALLGSAMSVMAEDPRDLSTDQLARIRDVVSALDQFIAPHGG